MNFMRSVLPNLSISLNLALMIVFYLDLRNPMMGFLVGAPFLVLAACTCLSSVATGILLYADWRKMVKYRQNHTIK